MKKKPTIITATDNKPEEVGDEFIHEDIVKAMKGMTNRVMVGIPMTGLLRSEWVIGRYGQVIPCNWSQTDFYHWMHGVHPLGFLVAEARNVVAKAFVESGFEWLFFIDHDTILPPMTLIHWNKRMLEGDVPVWCGLYFTKSAPAEPLIYRGRGNAYYTNWKFGDLVWVDGIPMGCTVIHRSIMKIMYDEAEEYQAGGKTLRKVYQTPADTWFNPEIGSWQNSCGTEDLDWCARVMLGKVFERAGWPEIAKKKYPFLVDTNVFCRHIDMEGIQYPSMNEEFEYIRWTDEQKKIVEIVRRDVFKDKKAIGKERISKKK